MIYTFFPGDDSAVKAEMSPEDSQITYYSALFFAAFHYAFSAERCNRSSEEEILS